MHGWRRNTIPRPSGGDRKVANILATQSAEVRAHRETGSQWQAVTADGPDGGTTNIRNVKSKHWTRWLEPKTAA
jgi:hypothetical protein